MFFPALVRTRDYICYYAINEQAQPTACAVLMQNGELCA